MRRHHLVTSATLVLSLAFVTGQRPEGRTVRYAFTPSRPPVHPAHPTTHLPHPTGSSTTTTANLDEAECADEQRACDRWAREGECEENPSYMKRLCRLSCGECTPRPGAPRVIEWASGCSDLSPMCSRWAHCGECERNEQFMKAQCRVSCGVCSTDECQDEAPDCALRASDGGCYAGLGAGDAMLRECAWTCGACNAKDEAKCARDRRARPVVLAPGDVGANFERMAGIPGVTVHATEPWVATVDNFVSDEEVDLIVAAMEKANEGHWVRSIAGEGDMPVRTSSSLWCRGTCQTDPFMRALEDRIAKFTGVPANHGEPMQLLKYEQGQFYRPHIDQNSPRASAWGPRVYTFYLYLSDVEEGGETRWPRVEGLEVKPKKGRALIWANVQDDDPYTVDELSEHEARPPVRGEKLGMIYWLHQWPFREKADVGCDNEAYVQNWSADS